MGGSSMNQERRDFVKGAGMPTLAPSGGGCPAPGLSVANSSTLPAAIAPVGFIAAIARSMPGATRHLAREG